MVDVSKTAKTRCIGMAVCRQIIFKKIARRCVPFEQKYTGRRQYIMLVSPKRDVCLPCMHAVVWCVWTRPPPYAMRLSESCFGPAVSVADLENFVGVGEPLLAACGRWSLSNRR